MGGVQLSPNIKKTSQRIDTAGNIIDPKTKQILVPVEKDYVPPVQVEKKPEQLKAEPVTEITFKLKTLSDIKSAIKQVEFQLAELQELKRKKVEEMKKELEEAE